MAKKSAIPKHVKKQVWMIHCGKTFNHKCIISWCQTIMDVFDFHVGHNIPESKGGAATLENLRPICSGCNLGMGDRYTIDEWERTFTKEKKNESWFWW